MRATSLLRKILDLKDTRIVGFEFFEVDITDVTFDSEPLQGLDQPVSQLRGVGATRKREQLQVYSIRFFE